MKHVRTSQHCGILGNELLFRPVGGCDLFGVTNCLHLQCTRS